MKSVHIFAPATVANLGCGFDVMGLAIDEPGDELMLSFNDQKKLIVKKISGDGGKLSYDAKKNTATVAIQSMLDELKSKQGFDIVLKKKMPLGSGLGSSAASSVAGVFAANANRTGFDRASEERDFRFAIGTESRDQSEPAAARAVLSARLRRGRLVAAGSALSQVQGGVGQGRHTECACYLWALPGLRLCRSSGAQQKAAAARSSALFSARSAAGEPAGGRVAHEV